MKHRNIIRIALATAFLLLIPLVAMRFTDEVAWTLFDFIFAGALLFGTGLAYELVARRSAHAAYRLAVGIAVVATLLLIWINGAVGFIGDEDNAVNLMYGGVLLIGIVGAAIARLQPQGMARVLLAMAAAQMLVPVIALVVATPVVTAEPPGIVGVFGLNAFFAMLFAGSAILFRRANDAANAGARV